jgi:NTE family protein
MASITKKKLGLSLSGGGYRATAFHLGTLNALQRLGLLDKVEVISTISGGSITGAYYCLEKDNYENFQASLYNGLLNKNVIKRVVFSFRISLFFILSLIYLGVAIYTLFTPYPWVFPLLLILYFFVVIKFQFYLFPISSEIEKAYDAFFFSKKQLSDLPRTPVIAIGSTNIQTTRPFTFSKNYMGDSSYMKVNMNIQFKPQTFPISRAVMASSCVPFAFTPIRIDQKYFVNPDDANRIHPILVDGGVYDNQGIHKLTQKGQFECSHVITSDAGAGDKKEVKISNTFSLLLKIVDVFMSRIKKAQMIQDIYENVNNANKEIAYYTLGWDAESCISGFVKNLASKLITQSVIDAHQFKAEWIAEPELNRDAIEAHLKNRIQYDKLDFPNDAEKKIARTVGTNLTTLKKEQIDALIKQADCLTELQVKLYCPSLFIQHD